MGERSLLSGTCGEENERNISNTTEQIVCQRVSDDEEDGMSEQIVEELGGWKTLLSFVKYERARQTINEKGIAVDALSRYKVRILQ